MQGRPKAPPATQNASRKYKNKEVRGGTKYTFLFQGKSSALDYKIFPGVIPPTPIKKGRGREKEEGIVCVMAVGEIDAPVVKRSRRVSTTCFRLGNISLRCYCCFFHVFLFS